MSNKISLKNKNLFLVGLLLVLGLSVLLQQLVLPTRVKTPASTKIIGSESFPVVFVPNQGQMDPAVKYYSAGLDYGVFVKSDETVLLFNNSKYVEDQESKKHTVSYAPPTVLHMKVIDSREFSSSDNLEPSLTKMNYLLGKDKSKWITNVQTFKKIRLNAVSDGVDLEYYGKEGEFEYDIVVAPEKDPSTVKMEFKEGKLQEDSEGNVNIAVGKKNLLLKKPTIYQDANGKRVFVPGKYKVERGNRVGFEVGKYDRSKKLILDPVIIFNAHPVAGALTHINDMKVNTLGETYVAGDTLSLAYNNNFGATCNVVSPTPIDPSITPDPVMNSDQCEMPHAYIAKFNSDASLAFMTFIGGSVEDSAVGVALDNSANIYLAGNTRSLDFPVAPAVPTYQAGSVFVSKLDPSGSQLLYSNFIPSTDASTTTETGGLGLDNSGNIYISGVTSDPAFPTVNSSRPYSQGNDIFVAKINPVSSQILYSILVGGQGNDTSNSLAVDGSGNVAVAGSTGSTDFNGGSYSLNGIEGLVFKVTSSGVVNLVRLLGGQSAKEAVMKVVYDGAGNMYAAGFTQSTDFPLAGSLYPFTGNGIPNGFLTKMDAAGKIIYSTFTQQTRNLDIVLGSTGDVYLSGRDVLSSDPNTNQIYVAKFRADGRAIQYSDHSISGYVGTNSQIGVDSSGDAYLGYLGVDGVQALITKVRSLNRAPIAGSLSIPSPFAKNKNVTLKTTFTDPDQGNTHSAIWELGDGREVNGVINESYRTVTGTISYTAAGNYYPALRLSDNSGGMSSWRPTSYLTVFSPTSRLLSLGSFKATSESLKGLGIFTSGLQTVNVNAGALYYSGSTPTGTAVINFPGRNNFVATKINWLVTMPSAARVKGVGMYKGRSGYSFLMTLIDNRASGQASLIRLKVADPYGKVVFDTQPGADDLVNPTSEYTVNRLTITQ